MCALLLLDLQTEDAARSPEMVYLASTLLATARRVCGEVTAVRWRPGLPEPELPAGLPALLVGRENVHLGARSLARMKAAVDAGAGIAAPAALADFDLAGEPPVHTLRGFEGLEARLLAAGTAPRTPRRSHLPVALVAAPLWTERLHGRPLAELLDDRDLVAALDLGDTVVTTGVYHAFIDYYGEVRSDILPFVPEGVAEVLEVGCGRGLTGELLERERGCRVTGVELNPEVAEEAAGRLHRVIVGDVERLELDGRFDAVVATELFEHLCYPERFLARMRDVLNPGGRIVLSVPNVGHYSIVDDLLAGRFDYLPIGLLCYTHFRFFTRSSLESWIERVGGFRKVELVAQTTELPERFTAPFPAGFELDPESLRTQGFYVVLEV